MSVNRHSLGVGAHTRVKTHQARVLLLSVGQTNSEGQGIVAAPMVDYARNKKATFNYEVLDRFEAGLVLAGHEVKAIRAGKVSLEGSYKGRYH
jgi:hypothetical protein